jgi:putative hemolysin
MPDLADGLTVAPALTPAEREACFALRYRVFVEEQGCRPPTADHERRLDRNADDETGVLLMARLGGEVVGTLRLHHGAEQGIPPFIEQACGMADREPDVPAQQTAAVTRLAIDRRHRGGPTVVALLRGCFAYLNADGRATTRVLILALDTPGHALLYRLLGFRRVAGGARYLTDVGPCVPMFVDVAPPTARSE